ncbi:MAG: hypothetical protein NC307_08860 [Roseburia sp.]|nr:hypothetical protein [Roseburia sp.]
MVKKSFFAWIKEKLRFITEKKETKQWEKEPEKKRDNPYLPYIRKIMETVLFAKQISYRDFYPVLVDGEEPEKTLFAAGELGADVNRMAILTDNAEYFEDYRDTMYEDQGLIVEIYPKEKDCLANLLKCREGKMVFLDFEREDELIFGQSFGDKIYIPVFKRPWEIDGNIDIVLPIGYNTMIVSGIYFEEKQPVYDKFEQAFYSKE